ncbi:thioredoxin family protein [Brevibacillus sp. SYSU BS000544]|uniref:thioredoxin family protein n=1 Tax=Brevibacillus sp. SYSU BS000544 TaxID=3416443 RepID=UPI003CE5ACE9
MSVQIAEKLGKGISSRDFILQMTKNQEQLQNWYDQFAFENEEDREFFQQFRGRTDLRSQIIAADWCGDVIRNVPVLFRLVEEMQLPCELMVMEEHLDLIDQFLTMGGRAIPIMLITDEKGTVMGKWGPRPEHVQAVMRQFKAQNPDRNADDYQEKLKETYKQMLQQYGEGTGYQQVIVKECRELFQSIVKD